MKLTIGAALAAGLLLVGQTGNADAVTVKPSGKYAFTTIDSCEAKFTFKFGSYKTASNTIDNAVREINSVVNGHIGTGVGTITFKPTSPTGGTFSMDLTDIGGGALRINAGGTNVSVKPQSFTGSYSYTSNMVTITPDSAPAMTF